MGRRIEGPREAIVAAAAAIAEEAGRLGVPLARVILFGSHARGEAMADSDVDLMLVIDRPVSFGNGYHPVTLDEHDALHGAARDALPLPASWPAFGTDEYHAYIEFLIVHAADPWATTRGDAEREGATRDAPNHGVEVWPG